MTKFPKKLFVKLGDAESVEDQCWVAEKDCEDLAYEVGDVIDVGVYELVSTGYLVTKTRYVADKARRRK